MLLAAHVIACFRYAKMFSELFLWEPKAEAIERNRKDKHPQDGYLIFSLGWNLFIYAKTKLLGEMADLVDGFHLLLCVAHLLLVHAPASFRRINFTKAPFGATLS